MNGEIWNQTNGNSLISQLFVIFIIYLFFNLIKGVFEK